MARQSVGTGAVAVEAALEATAVARHAEAADKEDHGREDVALLGEAEPGRILERLADRAEQVGKADDGDERGVLEEVDDVVDDARHDDAQRLRQRDEDLHLPPFEADGIGGFFLLDRYALQAAAHGLGHVGGVEQRERHHGADQAVDADAIGQEQRHHDGRHEEHRQQRHAAPQLDEADREDADHRQLRAAAERQQDAERQRTCHGHEGDDDVEHQPAPQVGVDERQAGDPADQQDAGQQREQRQQQDDEEPAMPGALAHDRRGERDQQRRDDEQPPQFRIGVVTPEEGVQAQLDEGPAGAVAGAGVLAAAGHRRVLHRPVEEGWNDQAEQRQYEHGDQRVRERAEQVAV